jgi:NAD(P)-dependent dehydrogenase (short-subunit alcohol dehydrogenase family)
MGLPSGSPFDLTGRVALVTGGNSGIGLGMADALAMHGAAVAIWGTNGEKNEAAAESLRVHGRPVVAIAVDVAEEAAVVAAMDATVSELGRLDACFANAGVPGRGPSFVEMTAEEWRRVTSVNLDGKFFTCREAVRHMVRLGNGGSLVLTTSGSALFGAQRNQNYAASHGGTISMMKGIAVEHARHGIRCNAVLPGWIETPMTEPAFGWDKFVGNVMPRVPMRRWGTPEDFGGLAVYLASDASSYMTGDVITIDGGYHTF